MDTESVVPWSVPMMGKALDSVDTHATYNGVHLPDGHFVRIPHGAA